MNSCKHQSKSKANNQIEGREIPKEEPMSDKGKK